MIDIKHEWHGKNVRLIDIDNQVFEGRITDVTGKEDNDETNRDSLTIFNGKDYIFLSDDEIKDVTVIN